MKAKLSESLFKGYRKTKKPGLTRTSDVRKSGYYWVKMHPGSILIVGEYDSFTNHFQLTGIDAKYPSGLFSYIHNTPIPKPRKK